MVDVKVINGLLRKLQFIYYRILNTNDNGTLIDLIWENQLDCEITFEVQIHAHQ